MEIQTINERLVKMRADAAKLNASLSDPEIPEEARKGLKRDYMKMAADIAVLKQERQVLIRSHPQVLAPKRTNVLRVANLLFPKDNRVQYFATELNIVDLMLLLRDVHEDAAPAVVSFYTIPEDQIDKIPQSWHELVQEEEPDKQSHA